MKNRLGWLALVLLLGVGTAQGQTANGPLLRRPGPIVPAAAQMEPEVGDSEAVMPLVEFRDISLQEAMRLLSSQTGLKIVPSAEAGKQKLSLYLRDVKPMTVVAAAAQANGLVYRRDPETGIVRIHTTTEYKRDLDAFREDQTRVFTLLYPNAVTAATAIRDLFGDRVRMTYGVNDSTLFQDLQQRFNRFDLVNSRSLGLGLPQGGIGGANSNTSAVGFGGTGGFGGNNQTSSGVGGLSNFNPQTQQPFSQSNQNRNADQKPEDRNRGLSAEDMQSFEQAAESGKGGELAEFLRRRSSNIFVTIVRANNQIVVRTSDPLVMAQVAELIARLDVPTPVVLLEVKVLAVNLADDYHSVFDYQFTDGVSFAGGFASGDILPPTLAQSTNSVRPFRSISPQSSSSTSGAGANDMIFQYVSATFRARLQLMEDRNRVTELATPLLMTANNEVSRIFVGESRPITIGFNNTTGNSGAVNTTLLTTQTVFNTSTPITNLQDIGTTLLITPSINNDRTVTLRLLQENSSVNEGGGRIPIPNAVGGVNQVAVDTVRRQNLSGTIVAKDGLTIAIGGLIEEAVIDNRAQVPVLGRIPGIGFFFRRQLTQRTRRELIVLVRPFILTTPDESAGRSSELLKCLSVHPSTTCPPGNTDIGSLGTFAPNEVPRAVPPKNKCQDIFRLHSVYPK